jgi:hypothetical protein
MLVIPFYRFITTRYCELQNPKSSVLIIRFRTIPQLVITRVEKSKLNHLRMFER